jgi:hypothetical protein
MRKKVKGGEPILDCDYTIVILAALVAILVMFFVLPEIDEQKNLRSDPSFGDFSYIISNRERV